MLLNKTAIVKWHSNRKKYYEDKGYVYTKMGNEFEVRVEDLTDGSHALVNVKCDCEDCKNPYLPPMTWQNYKSCVHEDGKYYCSSCTNKLYVGENGRKTKLLNSESFGYWLIKNLSLKEAIEIMLRWDNELNKKDIREVSYASGKKCYFKCPKNIHDSELKNISSFTSGKRERINCNQCNSFEQWCIDNNRLDVLARWNYELNIDKNGNVIKPSDISFCSMGFNRKGYWFNCPRAIHPAELKTISAFTSGKQEGSIECNRCNSFAQHLLDTYGKNGLKEYWDYEKNVADPWELTKNSNKKVYIFCQEKSYHGSYLVACSDFVTGYGCSYCGNFKVHPLDSLGYLYPEVIAIWSEKNEKSPYEYKPNSCREKVWWKCLDKKHNDYYRDIKVSNICDFRCPECVQERTESFLQEKTRLYLEGLEYTVLHERNCTLIPRNPKSRTNNTLPFDNEIKLNNGKHLICEVMGIQHYEITNFHNLQAKFYNTTPKQELHKIKLYDRYKRFIAYKNGYEYLEIAYWTDDKDETYKQLINDKIKEVLNNKKI